MKKIFVAVTVCTTVFAVVWAGVVDLAKRKEKMHREKCKNERKQRTGQ